MESPLKWLALFAVVIGIGYGAIVKQDTLYQLYKTHISPDPPPPPPPDMSNYIELKPVVDESSTPQGFSVGATVYIAGEQDVLGWDQSEVMLHYTWEGSGEEDKQAETWTIAHGTKCRILDIKDGGGGRWYRVETLENFAHRGWLMGRFLRTSRPKAVSDEKEWGAARESAEERQARIKKEQERQKRILEEARKRGG